MRKAVKRLRQPMVCLSGMRDEHRVIFVERFVNIYCNQAAATACNRRSGQFSPQGAVRFHLDIEKHGLTNLGYEVHPRGLAKILRYASRLGLPLIITENGIATHDTEQKVKFMKQHVDVVERCLRNGLDIRGYFYWTLIDNYEWLQGLDARFGLHRVDFKTLKRHTTSAGTYYSYLIQNRKKI